MKISLIFIAILFNLASCTQSSESPEDFAISNDTIYFGNLR